MLRPLRFNVSSARRTESRSQPNTLICDLVNRLSDVGVHHAGGAGGRVLGARCDVRAGVEQGGR